MLNIRSEYTTTTFFTLYFAAAFIYTEIDPGGPCVPGMGAALFFLAIPMSIIYSLILFYKLYRSEERQYLNSFYILLGFWILLFIYLELNKI